MRKGKKGQVYVNHVTGRYRRLHVVTWNLAGQFLAGRAWWWVRLPLWPLQDPRLGKKPPAAQPTLVWTLRKLIGQLKPSQPSDRSQRFDNQLIYSFYNTHGIPSESILVVYVHYHLGLSPIKRIFWEANMGWVDSDPKFNFQKKGWIKCGLWSYLIQPILEACDVVGLPCRRQRRQSRHPDGIRQLVPSWNLEPSLGLESAESGLDQKSGLDDFKKSKKSKKCQNVKTYIKTNL